MTDRWDVLRYPEGAVRAVPAGTGDELVAAHEVEHRKRRRLRWVLLAVLALAVGAGTAWALDPLLGAAAAALLAIAGWYGTPDEPLVPELLAEDVPRAAAESYDPQFSASIEKAPADGERAEESEA